MKIEIWSDVVCPFCYIGKRNFENALKEFPEADQIEVIWKSFQLDPTAPKTPTDVSMAEYLAEKYGWTVEKAQESINSMTQMAKSVGLDYKMDDAKRINTFNLHRMIQFATSQEKGDEMEEALFKAYFTEAIDLSKKEEQVKIMESLGFTEEDLDEVLADETYEEAVKYDLNEAQQLGVSGVPFFVLDRKYAINGAQPVEAFTQTIETAFNEWKQANQPNKLNVVQGDSCDIDGNCD